MRTTRTRAGFTIADLLAVLLAVIVLAAVTLPALARARSDAGLAASMNNLAILGAAHALYAADWSGRQVTWVRDDLGAYQSFQNYNDAFGCDDPWDPGCHPHAVAGWGESPEGSGNYTIWAYWSTQSNGVMMQPLIYPENPDDISQGRGIYRNSNSKAFHDYVNGRFHDPVYYAPKDGAVLDEVGPCLDCPCEFDPHPGSCNPGWSSYSLSPAAMYHPDVFRANADGGWQDPWSLDHGFQSPGLFTAQYPDLKTHMIEHHWLQGPPAPCNPAFSGCEPFYFNHGIDSAPATLFYDGHIRLLPNAEVMAADQQVLAMTDGVDGLWHRGTPFGDNGYYIDMGWDGSPLSHNILTTDGILGRDTLSEPPPFVPPAGYRAPRPQARLADERRSAPRLPFTSPPGDGP